MKETLYLAPTSVAEAVQSLAEHGSKVTVLAGGTDLMPKFNYYELKPEILMYIGNLGLNYIKEADDRIVIGALTPTAHLVTSELLKRKAPALAEAARLSGSPATRTTATLGGNLANASPAADLATPLLVLDAEVCLVSSTGERPVALKDFFKDVNVTALQPGELVGEVSFPLPKGKSLFIKLGRRKALTFSVVNVAVRLEIEDGVCQAARIALGSMAPIPLRCTEAEVILEGQRLTPALIGQAAAAAVAMTSPIDDQRATAWYRRTAGLNLTTRALMQAAGLA